MRVTIVTDVHSNLAALEAVLKHAEAQQALDEVWAMGDLVGYGPQPSECLAALQAFTFRAVTGNHDFAAIGGMDTKDFNPAAAAANRWNAEKLTDADRAFLTSLPQTLINGEMSLAHGSLRDPVWEYMISHDAAIAQFEAMTTPYSLVGHTHVALVFAETEPGAVPDYWQVTEGDHLDLAERRLIINPGSVGQPRDGDPRAGYCIYDSEARRVTFHRIAYDIAKTQAVMKAAGLPHSLIARLAQGR